MKKLLKSRFVYAFLFLLLFALILITPRVNITAKAEDKAESQLNQSVIEQLEQLDFSELQKYVDSLGNFSDKSVSERLLDYVEGEPFDYQSFFKGILSVLLENVTALFPSFICVAAVALLCGILSSLKSNFIGKSTSDIIFLVGFISALIPTLAVLGECFLKAKTSVESMQKQMQAVFPLLLTLMSASGGSVSAAIFRPAVAFLSTTIVSLIQSVVFPVTLTVIAFSIVGNLSTDIKVKKFSAFFKSINKWIIGVSISIFGVFFTIQGLSSASYDGITRRAAKYAIGAGVPIIGGFLSGGFDLAVAGSILIKNSLGTFGIFMTISVVFEPLLLLIATNLLLRLTAAITEPLGESRISDFLGETAENLNYCLAGLLFVAFLYLIVIVLIICSAEVIL